MTDQLGKSFMRDGLTDAIVIEGAVHYQIHKGNHYTFHDILTIAAAASGFWRLATGAKEIHLDILINSSLNGAMYFFEDSTFTGNGTTLTSYNSDRGSTNLPTMEISRTPTFDSAGSYGTQIDCNVIGSDSASPNGRSGGNGRRDNEIILKENSNYTLQIVSLTNLNRVSPNLDWYEILD